MIRTQTLPACPCCGAHPQELYKDLKDTIYNTPGSWALSNCPDCDLAWLNPAPLESDMAQAYLEYHTHKPQDDAGAHATRKIQAICAFLLGCSQQRKDMEHLMLTGAPPGKLLEIGAGNGSRLRPLSNLGWQCTGQEIDPSACASARSEGLEVFEDSIYSNIFGENRYDAIASNHVLEHVHEPVKILTRCRQLLRDDGRIVIITPNIRSLGHRLFGTSWRGLEPPRHIQIFSPRAIRRMLTDSGFRDISISTSSARADLILSASLELAVRGSHQHHHNPGLMYSIATAALWAIARAAHIVMPDSGEEIIAVARR